MNMTFVAPRISVPAAALRQLDELASTDWTVDADTLVTWVNHVVAHFLPDEEGGSGRVSREFTLRTLRHYQTLGCIDAPVRDGRSASYGFRQYVQALLVRKLIWERVPADRISELLAGRSTAEYRSMLLEGIEITARPVVVSQGTAKPVVKEADVASQWMRVPLAPGIEAHFRADLERMGARELTLVLETFEKALRAHLRVRKAGPVG